MVTGHASPARAVGWSLTLDLLSRRGGQVAMWCGRRVRWVVSFDSTRVKLTVCRAPIVRFCALRCHLLLRSRDASDCSPRECARAHLYDPKGRFPRPGECPCSDYPILVAETRECTAVPAWAHEVSMEALLPSCSFAVLWGYRLYARRQRIA